MGQRVTRTVTMSHQRPKQHFENVEQQSTQQLSPLDHILTASCQVNKYSPVTSLIGKQCLVTCYLQGHKTDALWDKGSQVCIVDGETSTYLK